MPTPAHPGLYDADAPVPRLRGTRCESCGSTFFPPLRFGCEVCGADEPDLSPAEFAARGVVYSSATVRVHHDSRTPTPFAVAEVVLDQGPMIRCLLAADTDDGVAIGDRVHAVWVGAAADAQTATVEPRFVRDEEGER